MLIYLAGKYRDKTVEATRDNIKYAADMAKQIFDHTGYIVHCPHAATAHLDDYGSNVTDENSKAILKHDFEIVDKCDAMIILSNWRSSSGAIQEITRFKKPKIYLEDYVKSDGSADWFRLRCSLDDVNCSPSGKLYISPEQDTESFSTGAVRDSQEGKPDFSYMTEGQYLINARYCKHLESGAKHYSKNNWMKGIPFTRCCQSLLRHIFQIMNGDTSEDHVAACQFNIRAMSYAQTNFPPGEINDRPDWGYPHNTQEYIKGLSK